MTGGSKLDSTVRRTKSAMVCPGLCGSRGLGFVDRGEGVLKNSIRHSRHNGNY